MLLLYAQPLTRIAQLRTSDILTADSGEIALTVARGAIVLPEPLASIALALRYQRAGDDEQDGWLLPGRKPGTHIIAEHLRKRLALSGHFAATRRRVRRKGGSVMCACDRPTNGTYFGSCLD